MQVFDLPIKSTKMKVNRETRLQDIQNHFTELFPYLKIAAYGHGHHDHEASPKSDELPMHLKISDINPVFDECELSFDGAMKVSDFESLIAELLGIHVQVFRKSNDLWLQTSKTDDWTLEKQNGKGYRSALNLYPDQDTEYDSD
jgi:hypothetical protein